MVHGYENSLTCFYFFIFLFLFFYLFLFFKMTSSPKPRTFFFLKTFYKFKDTVELKQFPLWVFCLKVKAVNAAAPCCCCCTCTRSSLVGGYTMMWDWLRFACDLGSQRKIFEHVQKPPATDYNPTFAQNP